MAHKLQLEKSIGVRTKMENRKGALQLEVEASRKTKAFETSVSLSMGQKDLERKLKENKSQLSKHLSTLQNLLHEVTEKRLKSDVDSITDIGVVHTKCEHIQIPAGCS